MALAAYTSLWKVIDDSGANPKGDWTAQIRAYAADPTASRLLGEISGLASASQTAPGVTGISPKVTKVDTALVYLTDCVDQTNVAFLDPTGKSIKAPDLAGTYYRHPSDVQVGLYEDGTWLVTVIEDRWDETC